MSYFIACVKSLPGVWARTIVYVYLFGLMCFFLAALALIWIFTGGNNWRSLDEGTYAKHVDNVSVVRLDSGELRGKCLYPNLEDNQQRQIDGSTLFAYLVSGVFEVGARGCSHEE